MKASTRQVCRRLALATGLFALCVGAMGSMCPPQKYHAVSLAPPTFPVAWTRALEDWTRHHKVYEWFDDKIDAHATYHAPALRKAYVDNRHKFFGEFSDVIKKELVDLGGGEAEHWHSFFVSAYVGWQKYKALTHSRTIWTLSLENDQGVRVVASKMKDVPNNLAAQAIYPYMGRYDRAYLVRFPLLDAEGRPIISATTKSFTLRISSAYAEAVLIWDLIPNQSLGEFGLPRDAGPNADAAPPEEEGGLGIGNILK
ncbi:MAG: hypothetical protein AB2A00_43470 [Myxococcota bacterium]